MPIPINEFWKLAVASGLLTPEQCRELHAAFRGLKGAAQQANSRSLIEWLVASGTLTRYQAAHLAAGRSGPLAFGDFVVCDRIETGRLAPSFRATSNARGRAILVFAAQLTRNADEIADIAERAHAALAIKSPHVSRVHQFVASHPPFVVVEDLQGQSLREFLAKQKPTLEVAYRIGFQAALGLVALHDKKRVHGGTWPENLWVEPAGTVKILQFPFVPDAAGSRVLELPAADYLAPELFDARQAANERTDIYSLGCTLYELVAGRVPFPGGTARQKAERHRMEIAQRLDRVLPGVSEELADLVAEMLDKEPMLRCETASHVAHLLAPFTSGSQRHSAMPPDQVPRTLTPGYGAWKAPAWQAPPQQTPPQKAPPEKSQSEPERAKSRSAKAEAKPPPDVKAAHRQSVAEKSQQPRVVENEHTKSSVAPRRQAPAILDPAPSPQAAHGGWDGPIVVTDAPATAVMKPARQRFSNASVIGAGVGAALTLAMVIGGLLLVRDLNSGNKSASTVGPAASVQPPGDRDDSSQGEAATKERAAAQPNDGQIDDDGQTLWTSPTAGAPLALRYLPSGAQAFLVVRPAELVGSDEGSKVLDALGRLGESMKTKARATLGVELEDIEQLSIALFPDESGTSQIAFAMRLAKAIPQATLWEVWGKPPQVEQESKKFFAGARWAYYLPEEEQGRLVAIAPVATMKEILDVQGRPLVGKGIERLLRASDAARHVNLLVTPSYLFTATLLEGDLEKLRDPLAQFLDESIEAVLVSAHLGDKLFIELRALARADQPPADLAALLRARIDAVPNRVQAYVASLEPQAHGRAIVDRFPRMVQALNDFTRAGVEDRQAVLRSYLPLAAAHNLALGAELTLSEQPLAREAGEATSPPAQLRAGVAAALEKRISLSFPRDTLERCLELLSQEINAEVVILGADLQSEGITRNQSFALDERDQPAREILLKVLKLANPDGKLVYVIKPKQDTVEAIFITTRGAAAKRGENSQ
jgi:serine/threonine protein kinase